MHLTSLPTVLLALLPLASSSVVQRNLPQPAAVIQQQPIITPSPSRWFPTKTLRKRGVVSDLAGDVSSILGSLGSDVPAYVASGVPNFFQNFPGGHDVQSSLGLDDKQVSALPTQVLNIP